MTRPALYRPALLGGVTLLLLISAVAALPQPSQQPLALNPDQWTVTGNFRLVQVAVNQDVTDGGEACYWAATLTGATSEGRLESPSFPAPNFIGLLINGNVSHPGNQLFFENVSSAERQPVHVDGDFGVWRRVTCMLPMNWRDTPIRLVAVNHMSSPFDGFGLTNPRGYNWTSILRTELAGAAAPPAALVALAVFLAPGLVVTLTLAEQAKLRPEFAVSAAAALCGVLGYLAFWIFLLSPRAGHIYGLAVCILSVFCGLALLTSTRLRAALIDTDVSSPLLAMALLAVFYQSLLYAIDLHDGPRYTARLRFLEYMLPDDNLLPELLANRLTAGTDPRQLTEQWHSSDRPPLQTGLYLVQQPAAAMLGIPPEYHYQVLAGALQCSWVAALWSFCRWAGLSAARCAVVLAFLAFCGFNLVNSVYAWPKMLASALALLAVILGSDIAYWPAKSRATAYIAGVSAACAWLAHGSSAFVLVLLPIIWLIGNRFPEPGQFARFLAVGGLLTSGWIAYGLWYDPVENRLVKWHLAGVRDRDGPGTLRTIGRAYGGAGWQRSASNKLANVRALWEENPEEFYYGYPARVAGPLSWDDWSGLRRREFHNLMFALGFLNIGWPPTIYWLAQPRSRAGRCVATCLGLGGLGLLIWVLLMFGPGTTVLHQGSYGIVLLLEAGLAAALAALPAPACRAALAMQVLAFLWVWVVTSPANGFGPPNIFAIPVAGVSGAALLWLGIHRGRESSLQK